MEAHHVKTVRPVPATLEEQFITLLFGHSNVNVAFNKTRVLGHMIQLPKDLVPTCLVQEWLGEIAITKTSATHGQCLVEGIVAVFPLVDRVVRQTGCPFTLVVRSNHGMWRGCTDTGTHATVTNATQEIEDIGFRGQFCHLGETAQETLGTHGFCTQTLSGNCPHASVASTHEGLEHD